MRWPPTKTPRMSSTSTTKLAITKYRGEAQGEPAEDPGRFLAGGQVDDERGQHDDAGDERVDPHGPDGEDRGHPTLPGDDAPPRPGTPASGARAEWGAASGGRSSVRAIAALSGVGRRILAGVECLPAVHRSPRRIVMRPTSAHTVNREQGTAQSLYNAAPLRQAPQSEGRKMKLGVTGASGQLGRLIVQRSAQDAASPRISWPSCAIRPRPPIWQRPGVEVRVADYTDPAALEGGPVGSGQSRCWSRPTNWANASRSTRTSSTRPRRPA